MEADLEVHVGAGAEARTAAVGDHLALGDLLVAAHCDARVVPVEGHEAVVVVDHHEVPVTGHPAAPDHRPGRGGVDGRAAPDADVEARVERPQRIPNGLVIGPETGQMKPELDAGAGSEEPEEAAACVWASDWAIFAASCALEAARALDSSISSWFCCFVRTRSWDFEFRELASWS